MGGVSDMQFNLTLLGQSLAFALFVWFCMRYVWPPLSAALSERQQSISEGLAAAEAGRESLQRAEREAEELVNQARGQSREIVEQANRQATGVLDAARTEAEAEGKRRLRAAEAEIESQQAKARDVLRRDLGELVIDGASRVLAREVDAEAHRDLVEALGRRL